MTAAELINKLKQFHPDAQVKLARLHIDCETHLSDPDFVLSHKGTIVIGDEFCEKPETTGYAAFERRMQ